ncbi:YqjF family protein [Paenibacillus eucommiae]|uniref:Uncharacterized protein YqjF (DUF2071 family) n=1 Tax=Paenibacillus eucommiae TaxID=1355755 RepID=A0ABS4IS00_9BACL|nr:DUF2071 domain-containing protein [Paenibacillus eucommiae]MBP1990352.1 uncharacterized protein YqjF (DUF2071 family) [Paenibacillus eucommiae]
MTSLDLINTVDHRPYQLPKGHWVMKQSWHDLLFAHWPVQASELLPLIPEGLELELWEGKPWISIVPFRMSGIRLRGIPPIPFTSRFPELNVRTYVTCKGKQGVYFFSLEASSRLAVEAARAFFHLPYMNAQISVKQEGQFIRYSSKRTDRRGNPALFSGSYRAITPEVFTAAQGTLLQWLTERYCLYASNNSGELFIGEIHHLPWGLQQAELYTDVNTMAGSHGIVLPEVEPLLTFTKRLEVLIWPIKKIQ